MIIAETPRRKRVTKLVNWGHWFTLFNILIAIVIASVYVFSSPFPSSLLGMGYLFANWLSHVGFLTFFGFVILILPLCYWLPNVHIVRGLGAAVAAVGLALLALDALVFNKHGVHLSLGTATMLKEQTGGVMANFGWQQWAFLGVLFLAWLLFQLIMANAVWQRIERLQRYHLSLPISTFFILCFVAAHGMHVWADARIYRPIVQQDDMFPLSYPATAKTLMSRYGLLDLDSYRQRKQLQLNRNIDQVRYPNPPVYCSIDPQAPVAVLIHQGDAGIAEAVTSLGLTDKNRHYPLTTDATAALFRTLYGLPQLYRSAMQTRKPLLLDIAESFKLPTLIYSGDSTPFIGPMQTSDWQAFSNALMQPETKFALGLLNDDQLAALLNESLVSTHRVLLFSLSGNDMSLYSNLYFGANAPVSSLEDIAPTVMQLLGCQAPANSYSTGQSLLNPSRDWLVTTQAQNLVILDSANRIEIDVAGNSKRIELDNGDNVYSDIDMNRVSQAVKHVSRFIDNR